MDPRIESELRKKADSWKVQELENHIRKLNHELELAKRTAQSAESRAIFLSEILKQAIDIVVESHRIDPSYTLARDPQGYLVDRLLNLRETIG